MKRFNNLPKQLQIILNNSQLVEESTGRVGDSIAKYKNLDGNNYYLKHGIGYSGKELQMEAMKLKLCADKKLNVPQVIFYSEINDEVFLLLSEMIGYPAHVISKKIGKRRTTELVALALAKLHNISTAGIFLTYTLHNELKEIEKFVELGMIDVTNFRKNNNASPAYILEYLFRRKFIFSEDVFTHGDFCLPNIIIDEMDNVRIVDWAKAGLGDRHRDFSAIEGSIKRNFGESYIDIFYRAYGLKREQVIIEKIKYYQLIDQFFYNKL